MSFKVWMDRARDLARHEVEHIEAHVRDSRLWYQYPDDFEMQDVYHYVIFGSHVDPDLGYNYVPVQEPVNSYRQRKIGRRGVKVEKLERWLIESLVFGTPVSEVQRELAARQACPAIVLATSSAELESLLAEAYVKDYCCPDSLDGGYLDLLGKTGVLFGWEEKFACEGGVTDRYYNAEMEREYRAEQQRKKIRGKARKKK
jgi:hypothetical protein